MEMDTQTHEGARANTTHTQTEADQQNNHTKKEADKTVGTHTYTQSKLTYVHLLLRSVSSQDGLLGYKAFLRSLLSSFNTRLLYAFQGKTLESTFTNHNFPRRMQLTLHRRG